MRFSNSTWFTSWVIVWGSVGRSMGMRSEQVLSTCPLAERGPTYRNIVLRFLSVRLFLICVRASCSCVSIGVASRSFVSSGLAFHFHFIIVTSRTIAAALWQKRQNWRSPWRNWPVWCNQLVLLCNVTANGKNFWLLSSLVWLLDTLHAASGIVGHRSVGSFCVSAAYTSPA